MSTSTCKHPVTGKEWLPSYNSITSARSTIWLILHHGNGMSAFEIEFVKRMQRKTCDLNKRLTKSEARSLEQIYKARLQRTAQ